MTSQSKHAVAGAQAAAERRPDYFAAMRALVIEGAAKRLNAVAADIPGLWSAPGYPELTTNQLVSIAFPGYTGTPLS